MIFYRALLTAALAIAVSGCGHVNAYVDAALDPSVSPAKADSIYLSLGAKPSIRERQLLVSLRAELCRGHFNVVREAAQSQWTLGLTSGRQTFETGASSTEVQLPGSGVVVGSAHRNFQTSQFALLFLYRTSDLAAGRKLPMWEGQVAADTRDFDEYEPVIFKNLLDVFGRNYSDETRIDKSYARKIGDCVSQGPSQSTECTCGNL